MTIVDKYKSLINQKVSWPDFLDTFKDEDDCLNLLFLLIFDGKNCKKCGRSVIENYTRISRKDHNGVAKKAFRCKSCRTFIYPLSETIFKKCSVNMRELFFTIFEFANPKRSTAAIMVCRNVSVSYKTAHRILMTLRSILYDSMEGKFSGTVEVDEAFIGKGSKVYNWSAVCTRKQPIIGIVERESKRARLFLVDNRNAKTIEKLLLEHIEEGSTVYTDSWRGYAGLSEHYIHSSVDHSSGEYVRGNVHTNSIESVWGRFKRNIRRSHIKISAKYVQLYINEFCWKLNSPGKSQMQLFSELLERCFAPRDSAVTKSKVKLLHRRKVTGIDPPSDLMAV